MTSINEACSFLMKYFVDRKPTLKEVVNKTMEYYNIKDHPFDNYVYILQFPSGKWYCGQTVDWKRRMKEYNQHTGSNPHITNALNKHGWANVKREYESISTAICADIVEIFMIYWYDLTNSINGYNKTTGGKSNYVITAEALETRSGVNHVGWGKPRPDDVKKKISVSLIGIPLSTERCANMSMAHKGVPLSIDHRASLSASMTDDRRAALSDKLAGIPKSAEARANMSIAWTDERREEFSIKNIGENNPKAKPVVVYGKVYSYAREAVSFLFSAKNIRYVDSFIRTHPNSKEMFYISKEFYKHCQYNCVENITREMYDEFD